MDNITKIAALAAFAITLSIPCIISWLSKPSKHVKYYEQPRTDIKPYTARTVNKAPARACSPSENVKMQGQAKPSEGKGKGSEGRMQAIKSAPSRELIEALEIQADAEYALTKALRDKAASEEDPVKRCRLQKQAAAAWVRTCTTLNKINELAPPA